MADKQILKDEQAVPVASVDKVLADWNRDMKNCQHEKNGGVSAAVSATEKMLDVVLSLPETERNRALKKAVDLNRAERSTNDVGKGSWPWHIPSITIAYADLDSDGKRDDVSNIEISYYHYLGNAFEKIDLYDP